MIKNLLKDVFGKIEQKVNVTIYYPNNKKYREIARDALILSFMFHQFLGTVSFVNILGKNSQIAHFCKLCCNLLLFRKYVRIYHFLGTQI